MPNRISNRQKAEELRYRKRLRAERAAELGGKEPARAIPVPSAAPRPSAARYLVTRASVGKRQEAKSGASSAEADGALPIFRGQGMTDRIFLRLNDRLALGADDRQWILYRSRGRVAPTELRQPNWLPIAFSSVRDILARCVRESGCGDDTAQSAVSRLEATFDRWKAAVARPRAAAMASEGEPA